VFDRLASPLFYSASVIEIRAALRSKTKVLPIEAEFHLPIFQRNSNVSGNVWITSDIDVAY